jgi:hypothetical protein
MDNATLSATISEDSQASTPAAITISADTVTLNNGTHITTETSGSSPGGNITFNVGSLTAKGEGPIRIQVRPESLITSPGLSRTGVLIASDSTSSEASAGAAGQITIQGLNGPEDVARTVSLDDTILHTRTFGGTAETVPAAITITADSVALVSPSNRVQIYTTANGAAPAGNVVFNVNTLRTNLNPDGSFLSARRPVLIGSPSEKPDRAAGPAGAVIISGPRPEPTDPAKLVALSNTEIDTFTGGRAAAQPAPIIITAETAALSNLTILVATSLGAAPAGDITFNVDTLRININSDGSPITNAGRVILNSPSDPITVPNSDGGPAGTIIISGLRPESTDPARLVDLYNATLNTLVVGGTADLDPGSITITADTMNMGGGTMIFSSTRGPAPAGNVALNVNTLRSNVHPDGSLIDDQVSAQITSRSRAAGGAGSITISGPEPQPTDSAKLIALNNTIFSTAIIGSGASATIPATILVTADTVTLANSQNIGTETSGEFPAGNMTFNVNSLTVDQGTKINSGTSGTGRGSDITILAGRSVSLNNGSTITAGSTGQANAGNININAGTSFLSNDSSVTTQASQGSGGNINLMAGRVELANGATISASSTGLGDAGSVVVQSGGDVLLTTQSKVSTSADQASGGNITLMAPEMIRLRDSQLASSVKGEPGSNAGNITIDPQFVIIQGSNILAQANQGAGGIITINATKGVLVDPNSVLDASAGPAGITGSVNIRAPVQNLSGTLVPLTQSYLQAARLLAQRCAARFPDGKFSTFVQAGREGPPVEPGGFLPTPLYMARSGGTGNATEETVSSYLGRDPTRALVWGRGCAY